MRLNLKTALLSLIVIAIFIICGIYLRCAEIIFPRNIMRHWDYHLYAERNNDLISSSLGKKYERDLCGGDGKIDKILLRDIDCIINEEYAIQCKHNEKNHEVYIPFSFIRNYFDITGSLGSSVSLATTITNEDSNDIQKSSIKFFWMHSTGKINVPKEKYNPRGVFMYFENYNVEIRDRVKCISAAEGVPVSIQWEKRGYFYPTQIAQFALSHYSKNLSEPMPRVRVLENSDNVRANWLLGKYNNLSRIWHPKFHTSIIQFETISDFNNAIKLSNVNHMVDLVLSADILLVTNISSLVVEIENLETRRIYRLYYMPTDLLLSVQNTNIYYGLKALNKWHHITRDIYIDVQKGLSMNMPRKSRMSVKLKRSEIRIRNISFFGVGFFDNLTLSTSDHMANFYDGAEWLVNNQDTRTGGWPNPVRRNVNGFAELRAGWLSAMGQGHAISVLARAYWHSGGDTRYLKTAALALNPYSVLSRDGGVLAIFMDKYHWYEEYPTTPPSFVLNGFIYSLLGLYDLSSTAPASIANKANQLFNKGILSLKKMLLLYDTGSGTSYDLRHLSLGIAPNLARWDYHATHVNQLLLLATIDNDPIITQTAERWKNYMSGKRAKHN